jgi:hypothetical protein
MTSPDARGSKPPAVITLLLGLCGIGMIASAFMRWLVYMGAPVTGWEYMASSHPLSAQPGKNILYCRIWGSIWFTGLWPLLLGGLLLLAAYLAYRGMTAGSIISLLVGLAGSSLALVNIIASSGLEEAAEAQAGIAITADVGYGLTAFLVSSLLAAILGVLGLASRPRGDRAHD